MNVFAHIEGRTAAAIDALKKEGALPSDLAVPDIGADVPRDPTHGDIAINAAMVLAKAAKMKPRDIAENCSQPSSRPSPTLRRWTLPVPDSSI